MSEGEIPKLVRDGLVAVLLTNDFGAGWYSWTGDKQMLFDPDIVNMIEKNTPKDAIIQYCTKKYPNTILDGLENLKVYWVLQDEEFVVEEYDGKESLRYREREKWLKA